MKDKKNGRDIHQINGVTSLVEVENCVCTYINFEKHQFFFLNSKEKLSNGRTLHKTNRNLFLATN